MSKRILKSFRVIDGGDMSSDITGPETNVESLDKVLYAAAFQGTAVGTYTVQVSNGDLEGGALVWVDLLDDPVVPDASTGLDLIHISLVDFVLIRFVYTATSGTGTLVVTINGAQVGGQ